MKKRNDDALAVIATFLVQLVEDRGAGSIRSLADYQARFPGFEELIAEEFAREAAAPEENDAPAPPLRIGRYEIEREIGRGGQGVVYAAIDPTLNRRVALKVLTGVASDSATQRERLRREAEALSRLEHPNLCHVYEMGSADGVPFISMQHVEGAALTDYIRIAQREANRTQNADDASLGGADSQASDGSISAGARKRDALLAIAAKIDSVARALHVAHRAGLVHRDVKPGNIMLTTDGTPVLLDFGLAHDAEDAGLSLTKPGLVMGTPAYMAPEQLAAKRDRADPRTDVYALAVTLFEALTLERPFSAPTREGLFHAIQFEEPPLANRRNPSIPIDLARVIAVGMEKDPAKRYDTAEAFADDLDRVLRGEPILARPPSTIVRGIRWFRRRPSIAALTVAFAAAAVLGGYLLANLGNIEDARRARDIDRARAALDAAFFDFGDRQWAAAIDGLRPLAARSDRIGAEAAAGLAIALQETGEHDQAKRTLDNPALTTMLPHLRERLHRRLDARQDAATEPLPGRWRRFTTRPWKPTTSEDFAPRTLDDADPFELYIFSQENRPDVERTLADLAVPLEAIDRAIALAPRPRALYYGAKAHLLSRAGAPARDCRIIADTLIRRWPDAQSSWFYRGMLLQTAGDWDAAIEAYREAIQRKPIHPSAWINIAAVHSARSQYQEAADTLETAASRGMRGYAIITTLLQTYLRQDRVDDGTRLLEQALAAWPDDPTLIRTRGMIKRKTGRIEEGWDDLRAAVTAEPYVAEHRAHLARALYNAHRGEEARAEADRAFAIAANASTRAAIAQTYQDANPEKARAAALAMLEDDPKSPDAHMVLAYVATLSEDWKAAIEHGHHALEARTEEKVIYMHLGHAYCNAEQRAKGLEMYQKALALAPDDGEILDKVALTLGDLKRWEEAKAACHAALRVTPKAAAVHSLLGTILLQQKKIAEAIDAYRQGTLAAPDDGELAYNLATTLFDAGRLDEAAPVFEHAITVDPRRASAHFNYGLVLFQQRQWAKAADRFTRTLELDPDHAKAALQLGACMQRFARWDAACEAFERAIAGGEQVATAYLNLAQSRLRAGRPTAALGAFTKAIEHEPDVVDAERATRWREYVGRLIVAEQKLASRDVDARPPNAQRELIALATVAGFRGNHRRAAAFWMRAASADSDDDDWGSPESFFAACAATHAAFASAPVPREPDERARRAAWRAFALGHWREVLAALRSNDTLRNDVRAALGRPLFVELAGTGARKETSVAGVPAQDVERWRRLVARLRAASRD